MAIVIAYGGESVNKQSSVLQALVCGISTMSEQTKQIPEISILNTRDLFGHDMLPCRCMLMMPSP